MVEIIPSILVQTAKDFLTQTAAVSNCLSMIQLDIADGIFVPNTTWADPEVVAENLEIDAELHLMVANPVEEARRWEGIDQIKRVLIHYESIEDMEETLDAISSYGWRVGLVFNPPTPLGAIETWVEELDAVMFMGVNPGWQGQELVPETLERVRETRKKYPKLFLSFDGAVNEDTISDIVKAGVSAVCPGSAIFGNERTPAENIQRMKTLIKTCAQYEN